MADDDEQKAALDFFAALKPASAPAAVAEKPADDALSFFSKPKADPGPTPATQPAESDAAGSALDFFSKRSAPAFAPPPSTTPTPSPEHPSPQPRRRAETEFMGGLKPSSLGTAAKAAISSAEALPAALQPPATAPESAPSLGDDASDFFLKADGQPASAPWTPPPRPEPAPEAAPAPTPASTTVAAEPAPPPGATPAAVVAEEPAPVVAMAPDFADEVRPPKSKLPLIAVVFGIAAAAAIAVVFVGGDGSTAEAQAPAPTDAAAPGTATPEPTRPAMDDEVLAAEEPTEDEPSAVEDEPMPAAANSGTTSKKKRKKKKKSSSAVSSGKSADVLLSEARKAAMAGNHSQAYELAKQSNAKKKSGQALQLMGVSACNMKSAGKAKFVKKKLSGSKRDAIVKLCKSKGLNI